LYSTTRAGLALTKEDAADTIKSQLRLAFQQATVLSTLISKLHTTVYPACLVFTSKRRKPRSMSCFYIKKKKATKLVFLLKQEVADNVL